MIKRVLTVALLSMFVAGGLAACGKDGKLEFPGDRNVKEKTYSKSDDRSWVK